MLLETSTWVSEAGMVEFVGPTVSCVVTLDVLAAAGDDAASAIATAAKMSRQPPACLRRFLRTQPCEDTARP